MSSKPKSVISSFRRFLAGFSTALGNSARLKVGLSLFLLLISIAVFEPVINDYRLGGINPIELAQYTRLLPPSTEHPLGTDYFGRDLLALQLVGLKNSLTIGLLAGSLSSLIAVVVAIMAGYLGGKVDSLLNSVTNSLLVIPALPILLAIAAYSKLDLLFMCTILAVFGWPVAARTIRAQILSLKERPYVELARVSSLNRFEIMFEEILPNLLPYVGVGLTTSIIGAILAETGLRVIGIGPAALESLGLLLNTAINAGAISTRRYNIIMSPIIILISIFVSLNLINVGLEEVFNPRLKKITGI